MVDAPRDSHQGEVRITALRRSQQGAGVCGEESVCVRATTWLPKGVALVQRGDSAETAAAMERESRRTPVCRIITNSYGTIC